MTDVQGNLLLDHLLGALISPLLTRRWGWPWMIYCSPRQRNCVQRVPAVCLDRLTGRPIAAISYALALAEMLEQAMLGIEPTHNMRRRGRDAGLAIGKAILRWPGQVRLLCPVAGRGTRRKTSQKSVTRRRCSGLAASHHGCGH